MTHPDTIATTKDKLTWYHWNHINTTYYNDTMKGQGVDPACPGCTDMFTHRAFGAQVSATGLSGGGLTLSGTGLSSVDVQITQLTMVVDDPSTWLSEVAKVTPAPSAASADAFGKETATSWSEISERSYIELSGSGANAATAKKITDHVNWDRYLSLIQGRVAFAPIKFNGRKRNRHHFAQVLVGSQLLFVVVCRGFQLQRHGQRVGHAWLGRGLLVAERAPALLQRPGTGRPRHHAQLPRFRKPSFLARLVLTTNLFGRKSL